MFLPGDIRGHKLFNKVSLPKQMVKTINKINTKIENETKKRTAYLDGGNVIKKQQV